MPQYARDLRDKYDRTDKSDLDKLNMIKSAYDTAKKKSAQRADKQQLATRGIEALFQLQKSAARGKFFPISGIYQKAKINPIQTPSAGLWVWDEKHGCGLVEKKGGVREYRIRDEFLSTLGQVLP